MSKFSLPLFLVFVTSSVFAAEPTLNFAEAYRAILDRSLRLENQRLNIEVSEKRKLQAYGNFLPSVSAELTDVEGDIQFRAQRTAAVRATANLFRSGGDYAGLKASRHDIENQKLTLARERQGAEDEAASALIQYIGQSRLVEIGEKLIQVRTDSLRVARERFDRGLMPRQEVDKTLIDLDITRARLADTLTTLAESAAKLETALGHTNVKLDWPWTDQLSKKDLEVDAKPFDLLRRPDYLASIENQEARSWRRRQAMASLLPSIDLVATYGLGTSGVSDRTTFVGLLTLSVPLFDGFKNWGEFGVERARLAQAAVQVEGVRRSAPAEVKTLKRSFTISRESAMAREQTARLTRRLYDDNLQRFKLGRASANDIAIDQARLLESQQLEVQGWLNAHATFLKLCHALGGFVDPDGTCRER